MWLAPGRSHWQARRGISGLPMPRPNGRPHPNPPTTRIGGSGHFHSKDLRAATTCSSSCSATVRGSSTTRSSSIRAITGRLARLSPSINSLGPRGGEIARARDGKVWPGRLPPPIANERRLLDPYQQPLANSGLDHRCPTVASRSPARWGVHSGRFRECRR